MIWLYFNSKHKKEEAHCQLSASNQEVCRDAHFSTEQQAEEVDELSISDQ